VLTFSPRATNSSQCIYNCYVNVREGSDIFWLPRIMHSLVLHMRTYSSLHKIGPLDQHIPNIADKNVCLERDSNTLT
jgi:hypothetical protein